MILVRRASPHERLWAAEQVARHHYLRSAPDPRSRPECDVVATPLGHLVGCLWWGRPEASCCYSGGLTYGSAEDVRTGRARYDRWAVLCLSRVWLSPRVQAGGDLCRPDTVPGFTDRRGRWRPTAASDAIRRGLARVGYDYLYRRPPVWVDRPYRIEAVLSYCDTARHKGTIYPAAGFELARTNEAGVQTWWTPAVAPLTAAEDAVVRERAAASGRSRAKREAARTLFD